MQSYVGLQAGVHPHQPELVTETLGDARTRPVGAEERCAQVGEQLRAVREHLGPQRRRTPRSGSRAGCRGSEHQRRDRPDEHHLGDASRAVTADVPHDFAAASRMTNKDDVAQVERLDHGGQVVGITVHRVAVPGLTRTTVPTTIVGDQPETVRRHEQELRVPHVRVERPAVAEHHRATRPPVLVEDRRTVVRRRRRHVVLLVLSPRGIHDTMRDSGPAAASVK